MTFFGYKSRIRFTIINVVYHSKLIVTIVIGGVMSNLGELVKKIRQSKGLSQKDVADASNLARSYISRLEDGDFASPSVMTLLRLAKGLNMSNEEMFNLAGVTVKAKQYPELPVYLRAETNLPEEAIRQITDYVELIKLKYSKDHMPAGGVNADHT